MNLETLASLSQIIGTVTIVGGTVFGLIQLWELKKQRRNAVAGDLMRTFMDADLAQAITLIRALPDGVSAEELRSAGPETERAAVLICTTFETMGLLVFQRIAPFSLVMELAGGITVVMWHKLGPWLTQIRKEQSQPSWAEWFQWLAQQSQRHKSPGAPAYVLHDNWTP
ncbi:MAG: DUF4760 domain-containing protein [Arenimonas sp.]|jgi:hypothetical protein